MKRLALACMLSVAFASPAAASCVVCAAGATCDEVVTSGNCECRLSSKENVRICKPVGVCDPNDPSTCGGGAPPRITAVMDLRAEGVDLLWRQDRLLGAALWGASDLEYREDGTAERRILEEGVQAGTFMTPEGGRFSFQVTAQEVTPSSTRLLVRIENYDTGEVRLYEGDLAQRSLRGELYDLSAGRKAARRLSWDLGEPRRSR